MMHPLPPASVTLAHARATLRTPGATEAAILAACTQLDLRGEVIDRLAAVGTRHRIEQERLAAALEWIVAGFAVACVLIAGWWG